MYLICMYIYLSKVQLKDIKKRIHSKSANRGNDGEGENKILMRVIHPIVDKYFKKYISCFINFP